ncbi:MAG: hypothetical protein RBT76_07375 [candidate division Zixibacteria bacterium]|jgi:hypothetical protein|nr:hypothetical protein [candidate division Zixibacteria bacterium]
MPQGNVLDLVRELRRDQVNEGVPSEEIDVDNILENSQDQFNAASMVVLIHSKVLEDELAIVPEFCDSEAMSHGLIGYTFQEFQVLAGLSPSLMKRVHELKKKCGGEILTGLPN